MRPPALWEDTKTPDRVKAMIPVSIGLHAAVVGGAILASIFAPRPTLAPPSYEVSLVAPIMKGSPGGGGAAAAALRPPPGTATTPPPEIKGAPTPPPAAAKLPAPDAMSTPSTKPESKAEALARIQKRAALQRAAEAEASRHAKTSDTPQPGATPVAANPQWVAKAGAEGSGEGSGNGGSEYGVWDGIPGSATYETQITAIIQRNWDPFNVDEKHPLEAVIRIVIGFDGKIVRKEIESSSGNASFDNSALAALIKSNPLPQPPTSDAMLYLSHKGLPIRFNSRTKLAGR